MADTLEIPAVLYAAKSTPDEKDSNGSQLEECRRRALDEEGRVLVSEHSEDDTSGWKADRGKELELALKAAEAAGDRYGTAELWVWKSERLARGSGRKEEARSLLEVYTRCKRAGVTLRSVKDDEYVQNDMLIGAASQMAEKYSADLSVNVAAGMRKEVRKGRHMGQAPLGYRREGRREDSRLVVVPEEAVTVQRVFAEFVSGRSMHRIAKDLNAEGIPTKRGVRWRQSTVSVILRNSVFCGKVHFEGEEFDGLHDPIIDPDTFEQARLLLAAIPPRPGRRPSIKRHLFLGGFLRCAVCGAAMIPRFQRERNYEFYECSGHDHGCRTGSVRRRDIDEDVFAYFEKSFYDAEETRRQITTLAGEKVREATALLASAERETGEARRRLEKIRRDYTHGDLSAADWRELRAELEPEAAAASAEAGQLREQLARAQADVALGEADAEVMAQLARIRAQVAGDVKEAVDLDAVRAVLMRLFDCFLFHPELPEGANVELVGNRYWIEPVPKEEVIEALAARGMEASPPKALGQAQKKYDLGSPRSSSARTTMPPSTCSAST